MVENIKTNDKQVTQAVNEPEQSLYNRISTSVQEAASAISKAVSSQNLESATSASSPTNLTIGGLITSGDMGNAGIGKAPGLVKVGHESPVDPFKVPARTMTEIMATEVFRRATPREPGLIDCKPPWKFAVEDILPWPGRGMEKPLIDLSSPDQVARDITKDQEVGEFAFKKIQGFLKNNKSEDAQKYIDKINDELQHQEPPSKFKLEMKDFNYPGYQLGRRESPGAKGIELRLVDKTKSEKENDSTETPCWKLKSEKTGGLKINPGSDSGKIEYPSHEKFESPKKRTERLADESAADMAKKLNDTKDLESIKALLEKSGNIEGMVKRINEKLQKPLSLSVESLAPKSDSLTNMVWTYKLDLKENGKSISSDVIYENYFQKHYYELHKALSGNEK